MENITITSMTDKKFGKPDTTTGQAPAFWGVTLSDGRKATIWDETIQAGVAANIGNSAMAEIKGNGTFLNIRSFIVDKGLQNNQAPKANAPQETKGLTSTGDSIVAQVCVKEACENLRNLKGDFDTKDTEEFLCKEVQMLAKVYKVTLGELQR